MRKTRMLLLTALMAVGMAFVGATPAMATPPLCIIACG